MTNSIRYDVIKRFSIFISIITTMTFLVLYFYHKKRADDFYDLTRLANSREMLINNYALGFAEDRHAEVYLKLSILAIPVIAFIFIFLKWVVYGGNPFKKRETSKN